MKVKIKTTQEVEAALLKVKAGVRYWEDAEVNGVDDEDGTLIPCREGGLWCPIIDISTGVVLNWIAGVKASIHYKVCDQFSYWINDTDGNVILSALDEYVPKFMCPKDEGFGDYIIMDIDENGKIDKWKISVSDFEELQD